jgi:iron complex transport system ATP-binding protein
MTHRDRTDESGADPVLEFEGVTVGYEDPVVTDVSFSVGVGEIVGLLGPNGVGKTTLLKCATGLLDPMAGSVTIGSTPLGSLTREDVAREIGYVPQNETTVFPRTVFRTVLMGRKPHFGNRPGERDRAVVATILERLDIGDLAMRDVGSLSGGQQQKVILARAFAQEPRGLVLDEPTSDLDVRHELEVLSLLRSELPKGLGVLHAMHDLTLASRYSDHVILLADDGVYAQGTPEILTEGAIADVYGIEVSTYETDDGPVIVPETPESESVHID